jgi:hypothetical protein
MGKCGGLALGSHVAVECAAIGEALAGFDEVGGVVRRLGGVNGLSAERLSDAPAQRENAVGLEIAEARAFDVHGSYP